MVRGQRKAIGGQDLRFEAVASRWWTIGTSTTEMTSRWLYTGHRFLVGGLRKAVGAQLLRLEAVASRW